MRILQVTPGYFPTIGGVEYHVKAICEALVLQGHEVSVVTMSHKKDLLEVETIGEVVIRRLPAIGPQGYRYPLGMLRFLLQVAPEFDIIHAHNYGSPPLLLAVLAGGKRTVITPHYHGRGQSRIADILHLFYDPIAIPVVQRAGGVVCVSQGEAEQVARRLRIARDRITVIPNAISFHKVNVKEKSSSESTNKLILSVGRLVAYKRVDRAIKALRYLPEEYILIVIGIGPEQKALEQVAQSTGIASRVRFLGKVGENELFEWYARSKVVVSLSEGEAFGRIVVEGLASGCRLVCSDIPAFHEFSNKFPEDVSLIPSEANEEIVAEAIRMAANKPSHFVDLQAYSGAEIADQLTNVYDTVLNGN